MAEHLFAILFWFFFSHSNGLLSTDMLQLFTAHMLYAKYNHENNMTWPMALRSIKFSTLLWELPYFKKSIPPVEKCWMATIYPFRRISSNSFFLPSIFSVWIFNTFSTHPIVQINYIIWRRLGFRTLLFYHSLKLLLFK